MPNEHVNCRSLVGFNVNILVGCLHKDFDNKPAPNHHTIKTKKLPCSKSCA